jgi:hypothetical protein
MAKIYIERSYIDISDPDDDQYLVELYIKEGKSEVLAGRVDIGPRSWIYIDYNEDKDLILNHSPGMDGNKWDHITREILDIEEILEDEPE